MLWHRALNCNLSSCSQILLAAFGSIVSIVPSSRYIVSSLLKFLLLLLLSPSHSNSVSLSFATDGLMHAELVPLKKKKKIKASFFPALTYGPPPFFPPTAGRVFADKSSQILLMMNVWLVQVLPAAFLFLIKRTLSNEVCIISG